MLQDNNTVGMHLHCQTGKCQQLHFFTRHVESITIVSWQCRRPLSSLQICVWLHHSYRWIYVGGLACRPIFVVWIRLARKESLSWSCDEMNLSNYIEMRILQAQLHRRCRATSFDRTIGIDIMIVSSLLQLCNRPLLQTRLTPVPSSARSLTSMIYNYERVAKILLSPCLD